MSRRLILLRPEPGASDTAAKAAALGIETGKMPLFETVRVPWTVPDPAGFDALLLTSANAVRQGGPGLQRLRALPVHAVGKVTGDAALGAGFSVASVGGAGIDALLAGLPKGRTLLHLAGEDRTAPHAHGAHLVPITVYRAAALDILQSALALLCGAVVAVHSQRAGERLAGLIAPPDRTTTSLIVLSEQAGSGVGAGWASVAVARRPTDAALLAIAAELCL